MRARVVGAALQWTLPCVVLAALAALAAQHTDLGVCAALAGTLECATQGTRVGVGLYHCMCVCGRGGMCGCGCGHVGGWIIFLFLVGVLPGPNSFQDNPFLPALFNFSLMCHALTFALSYAYALIAVRPEFRK